MDDSWVDRGAGIATDMQRMRLARSTFTIGVELSVALSLLAFVVPWTAPREVSLTLVVVVSALLSVAATVYGIYASMTAAIELGETLELALPARSMT